MSGLGQTLQGPLRGYDLACPLRPESVGSLAKRQSVALCHRQLSQRATRDGMISGTTYSNTSVAVTMISVGMVKPSIRAVLRLSARSNRVGSSIGRSPGFAPFRILST